MNPGIGSLRSGSPSRSTSVQRGMVTLHLAVLVIAALSLFALQFFEFSRDPGVGWHLKSGEYVLEHRAVPSTDPFLLVPIGATERPWVSDQWLSDVILHTLVERFGWELSYSLLGALFLLTFFLLLDGVVSGQTGLLLASTLSVFIAFKASQVHFIFRPVIFAFPCFAMVLHLTRRFALATDDWPPRTAVAALILIFVLWANLHPSFAIGLVWTALVPLARMIEAFPRWPFTSLRTAWPLALPVVCFAASLLNPYGFHLHRSILELGNDEFFMNLHEEWLSPNFKLMEGALLELLCGVVFLALLLAPNSKRRFRAFDLLGFALGTHAALQAVRMIPFCMMASAPLFALALARLGEASFLGFSPLFSRAVEAMSRLDAREPNRRIRRLSALVIAALPVSYSLFTGKVLLYSGPVGLDDKQYPVQALQYLTAAEGGHAVLTSPEWGGFITYRGLPKIRAVMDDRNTLLGATFYKQYLTAVKTPEAVKQFMSDVGVSYVMVSSSGTLLSALRCDRSFQPIYGDDVAQIFRLDIRSSNYE